MAVSDVYSAHVDLEMPSGSASLNYHYQETTPPSSTDGPDGLAQGIMADLVPDLRNILSVQTWVTQVRVYKKAVIKETPAHETLNDGAGLSPGNALPAQFAAKIALLQTFFPSSSNGMVWIPGIDEANVTVSLLDPAYRDVTIKAYTDKLLLDVVEPAAGDGRWRLVVVSRKFLVANPGDWVGASADVTGINRLPLVGRQRRRRTKVRGGAAA